MLKDNLLKIGLSTEERM